MKPLSKKTRNRLLWLASVLDRRATAIRRYVKARTPTRMTRELKAVVSDIRQAGMKL